MFSVSGLCSTYITSANGRMLAFGKYRRLGSEIVLLYPSGCSRLAPVFVAATIYWIDPSGANDTLD